MDEKIRPKITFLSKDPTVCPVCEKEFFRESLLTGSGRLIAGEITDTLHRTFLPSQTYGKVFPLAYPVTVCPDCFFATLYQSDFGPIADDEVLQKLRDTREERIDLSNKLIGDSVDYSHYRTLETGAASYVLAMSCYDYFPKKSIPVIKQALCAIRAAFLFGDLEKEQPGKYFQHLSEVFYRKALFFYKRAVELNQKKEQILENLKVLGPDIDKDYGYDGVTYLTAALSYLYGNKDDTEVRKKDIEEARLYFGRLFGMGKSNVNKPKEILEKSKTFYDTISKEIKKSDG